MEVPVGPAVARDAPPGRGARGRPGGRRAVVEELDRLGQAGAGLGGVAEAEGLEHGDAVRGDLQAGADLGECAAPARRRGRGRGAGRAPSRRRGRRCRRRRRRSPVPRGASASSPAARPPSATAAGRRRKARHRLYLGRAAGLEGRRSGHRGAACAFWSPTTTASARPASRWPRRSPRRSPGPTARSGWSRPAFEQSGVAHCGLLRPADAARAARASGASPSRARRRTACSPGSARSCKDAPPDLVISGVNRGHNVAEDTLYSGTVGGAMEAALHGRARHRAVAVLRPGEPRQRRRRSPPPAPTAPRCVAPAARAGVAGRRRPTASSTTSTSRRCRPTAVRGTRATFQGYRDQPTFGVAAARRAERAHLPVADPRPRQRRRARRARTRASATTATSPSPRSTPT